MLARRRRSAPLWCCCCVAASHLAVTAAEAPREADEPLPCSAEGLDAEWLQLLVALSGRSLAATADLAQARGEAVAESCVASDNRLASFLARVPGAFSASMLRRMRSKLLRRGASAGALAGVAVRGWTLPHGGWFAACLPTSCLGHERAALDLASAIAWKRGIGGLRLLGGMLKRPRRLRPQLAAPEALENLRLMRVFPSAAAAPVHGAAGPEALLDPECLEGAGTEGPFDIVTITDKPERAQALVGSLQPPLRLRFLQPPRAHRPWRFRFFDAERYLLAYVAYLRRRGFGDRLVFYADAFDTAWLGCTRDLVQALEALGRPMYLGAEFDLYPGGTRGYPEHSRSHRELLQKFPRLSPCRPSSEYWNWEPEPPDEREPCLATELRGHSAIFANGGAYGGRAWALERALRHVLARQQHLPELAESGAKLRHSGRTHQYFWNQYSLDRPADVRLDYGGAFVVNLAQRSLVPRHFGLDYDSGQMRALHFQRPVCLAHANGGGWADNTLQLLRTAVALRADTTIRTGVSTGHVDALAESGVHAELDEGTRVVVDTSLCFGRLRGVGSYSGVVASLDLLTPYDIATLEGLQFFVARPRGGEGKNLSFLVTEIQHTPIYTAPGIPDPPPAGAHPFFGRTQFDISPFRMRVRPGDCLGWRCTGRCDLTYRPVGAARDRRSADALLRRSWGKPSRADDGDTSAGDEAKARDAIPDGGAWLSRGDIKVGAPVVAERWMRRSYVIGAMAEVFGYIFYEPEDGG
eukprot:TRINITY_DN17721_c0_g6_i1.p1 TRINITY_DN17721_c0_g6~~TRINITY_DN17721_c0_g6_i1.p1  ORF type:complete len:753 (+),score=127.49 TRINITY_DN17721_c0_g6_i1:3-2261(+)